MDNISPQYSPFPTCTLIFFSQHRVCKSAWGWWSQRTDLPIYSSINTGPLWWFHHSIPFTETKAFHGYMDKKWIKHFFHSADQKRQFTGIPHINGTTLTQTSLNYSVCVENGLYIKYNMWIKHYKLSVLSWLIFFWLGSLLCVCSQYFQIPTGIFIYSCM